MPKGQKALPKGGKGGGGKGPSRESRENQKVLDTIGDEENAGIHSQLSLGRVVIVNSRGNRPRVVVETSDRGRLSAGVRANKRIAKVFNSFLTQDSQPGVLVEFMPFSNSFNILAVFSDENPAGLAAIIRLNMKLPDLGKLPPRLQTAGEVNLDGVVEFAESSDEEEGEEVDMDDL